MQPLLQLIRVTRLCCARAVLAAGARTNAAKGHTRLTPLHMAAVHGHADVFRMLRAAGARTDAANNWGATPLHLAAGRGHTDIVSALLAAGACGESAVGYGYSTYGYTPLHSAADQGHLVRRLPHAARC